MKNQAFSAEKKDKIKLIRSIIQFIILLVLAMFLFKSIYHHNDYIAIDDSMRVQSDKGFVALSYFGVERSGHNYLINEKRLDEHLAALKESGYVTISQEDIIAYYNEGRALPDKSLFLMFEDGRKDTALFAQKIMENYNYKATIFNYAQNLSLKDPKFLSATELLKLEDSDFWEIGSNGYRLAYINVFDRYDYFFDALNTYEFQAVSSYLDGNYNHYLMDFIRDESGIPKETLTQMKERIANDYILMQEVYKETLGKVPSVYVLMHANTGQFATNEKVSIENEQRIKELYTLNFNREGDSLNLEDDSIYDLTRMQPQAHWYTNHLLMRIQDDTQTDVAFVSGDTEKKSDWNTIVGESEFKDNRIILTSPPVQEGIILLNQTQDLKDFSLSVRLEGNKLGEQAILLRYDDKTDDYIKVMLKNNELIIFDTESAKPNRAIFELDLDVHDGIVKESIETNKLRSLITKLETDLKYANSIDEANSLNNQLKSKKAELQQIDSAEGEEYSPKISQNDLGNRLVELTVIDNQLSISIDGRIAVSDLKITRTSSGTIALTSQAEVGGFSERNLYDDVYDAVYTDLVISQSQDISDKSTIYYDNRLLGLDKFEDTVESVWNYVINWFIKNL